jgi:cyclopropane fatty-acyl-phospholipid synthase-like methyltransferase
MKSKVELFYNTYRNFTEAVYRDIRKDTYEEDFGQNSWITADEYRSFISLLKLSPGKKILEIAAGSGGPAVFMVKETACHLTGIDINENGVTSAKQMAEENGLTEQLDFRLADASLPLPFPDGTFDAIISIDSINHLKSRNSVLKEFNRVLKHGGILLFTDPMIITGIVTNEEIAIRTSIGFFLIVPVGENELLLNEAGFSKIISKDVTDNMALVSLKWYNARENRRDELLKIEDSDNFNGLQSFFKMVNTLSAERRLSRFMFTAVK